MKLPLTLIITKPSTSGLSVTTFTQTFSAELLTFGDFSSNTNWTTETGWVISGGVLTGTPVQSGVTYQGIPAMTANQWFEISYDVPTRTAGEISAQVGTSAATRGTWISSAVSVQELGRFASGAPIFMIVGNAVTGFGGTMDNASVKLVTQNTVRTMPSADGTHTFSFTLPGSPKAGQRAEMRYRVQDAANYWAARVIRNAANTAWDFVLASVSSGTATARITVTDVGTPDTVRVVTNGTTHTPYTGVSGTYTQRSSASVSYLDTETGITTIYNSAITPVSLTSF